MAGTDVAEDVVGGRYRLLEVIGSGGMGRVWRAEDQLLRRTVAIKEIEVPPAAPLSTQLQTMREARAAARLDHPGVVKVFDVVWQPDRCWIVMEFVRSRSLHDAVLADGPLPHPEAARIGLQVLSALRAAHAAGVLHRDVKPQNVLLGTDGRVVLGDFGLATTGEREGRPDPLLGSPYYVAPERLRDDDPDAAGAAADLWSLGATLYTAVEGRPPFARPDTAASLLAVTNEEPAAARHPGPLTPVIMELLTKDPDRRPGAAAVEARLRSVYRAPAGPWRGTARVSPASAAPASASAAAAAASAAAPARASRTARLVLAATVVAVIGTGGAAIAVGGGRDSGRAAAATIPATARATGPAAAPACGAGTDARPVVAETARVPAGLPAGWVWVRDPTGFALGLPRGWQRSVSGMDVCFTDPQGRRAFTVNSAALVTRRPLAYWQSREKAELAGGTRPGYARISMGVLLLRRGAADWEYTWRPDSDTTQHVRRILLAVTDNRSYLLEWATADADWARTVELQKQLVTFFAYAA